MDAKYGVSDKAMSAWGGVHSYFEKALGTPTGQKVREFYLQSDKQVRDVHNEARRLADLKAGKTHEPETVPGPEKTTCSCGGAEGVCTCASGKHDPLCFVCHCSPSPGLCSCANCAKSSDVAPTEVKEAAQASGQQPPAGSV